LDYHCVSTDRYMCVVVDGLFAFILLNSVLSRTVSENETVIELSNPSVEDQRDWCPKGLVAGDRAQLSEHAISTSRTARHADWHIESTCMESTNPRQGTIPPHNRCEVSENGTARETPLASYSGRRLLDLFVERFFYFTSFW
jgi:hypothetical protein